MVTHNRTVFAFPFLSQRFKGLLYYRMIIAANGWNINPLRGVGRGGISFPGPKAWFTLGSASAVPEIALSRGESHAPTGGSAGRAGAGVGLELAVAGGLGVLLLQRQGQGHFAAGAEGVHHLEPDRERRVVHRPAQ